jgi:hypothetical protein
MISVAARAGATSSPARQDRVHDVSISPPADGFVFELLVRLLERQRRLVRARGRQGIENVHDRHDLRKHRDFVALEPFRVTRAVEPLVVIPHDGTNASKRAQLAAEAVADDRVLLHDALFFRRETSRLQQDRIRDPDLADIVKKPALGEGVEVVVAQSQLAPDGCRVAGEPLAVADGRRVARFDRHRQTHDDGFGRIQFVREPLDAEQ